MMSITSFPFIIFFTITYVMNFAFIKVRKVEGLKSAKLYKQLLLIESYCFLCVFDFKTVASLCFLTIVCYVICRCTSLFKENIKLKKVLLSVGLIISLGQLCWYKYYDFFAESICNLFDYSYRAKSYPIPLGISFFTFSAIAYLVDFYKTGTYNRFSELALYLAYFPKFISGPIMKPNRFFEQLKIGYTNMNLNNLQEGIQFVVWGLFKKMVIADHLAIFVDDVFKCPSVFSATTCLWVMISYSLQIYFDFAGYSDMAIGFSKMLGIHMDKNFNLPYISKNVTEFWKRWHISLSSWLQEYVYISLGGNRNGILRMYFNLIVTMVLGGLWHGASWTFVIWGLIHGIALAVHKKFKSVCGKTNENSKIKNIIAIVFTFVFVSITWVFFRANDFGTVVELFEQIVLFKSGISQIYTWTWLAIIFAICEIAISVLKSSDGNRVNVHYPIMQLNTIRNQVLFFCLVGLTIILAYVGETAFIYGKF